MKREVVEVCPHCMGENILQWDVESEGYEIDCQHCGERIMLCDECRHADDNANEYCDWTEDHGCWRKKLTVGKVIEAAWNSGLIDCDTEIVVRDSNFNVLDQTECSECKVESFTWQDDNYFYIDVY